MTSELKAADLGNGAVIQRGGRRYVKRFDGIEPWVIRGGGRCSNAQIDQLLSDGATITACCNWHGIGDHDSSEHGPTV